jgi:ADP-ribose pyrophosphatase YjhB (NUDIX family)
VSYGIALCRRNAQKNNKTEILMIKKRYSYYFFNFVMGHYKKNDIKKLKYLLDHMTFNEKIDILSMNFDILWYKVWLYFPNSNRNKLKHYNGKEKSQMTKLYLKKKHKFEISFSESCNRRYLTKLIQQSKHASSVWEVPKGRCKIKESHVDCAVREFYEETNINSSKYTILKSKPIIHSYKDENVIYKSIYYIAKLKADHDDLSPVVNFTKINQISEIKDIKWICYSEIDFLYINPYFKKKIQCIFKSLVKLFKKSSTTDLYEEASL